MMKPFSQILVAATLLAAAHTAYATTITLQPNQTATADVTANGEPNRISLKGVRIATIWGNPDSPFHAEIDPTTSDVYIRCEEPSICKAGANKTYTYFITDRHGFTYELALHAVLGVSQDIVIEPSGAAAPNAQLPRIASQRHSDASQYPKRVMFLMRAMRAGVHPAEYDVIERNQPVLLWNEIHMRLVRVYKGDEMSGFEFELTNVTSQVQRIQEPEFMAEGVLAVMIEDEELAPGQTIHAWVIREGSRV